MSSRAWQSRRRNCRPCRRCPGVVVEARLQRPRVECVESASPGRFPRKQVKAPIGAETGRFARGTCGWGPRSRAEGNTPAVNGNDPGSSPRAASAGSPRRLERGSATLGTLVPKSVTEFNRVRVSRSRILTTYRRRSRAGGWRPRVEEPLRARHRERVSSPRRASRARAVLARAVEHLLHRDQARALARAARLLPGMQVITAHALGGSRPGSGRALPCRTTRWMLLEPGGAGFGSFPGLRFSPFSSTP